MSYTKMYLSLSETRVIFLFLPRLESNFITTFKPQEQPNKQGLMTIISAYQNS